MLSTWGNSAILSPSHRKPTNHTMKKHPLKQDQRYTVTREFCGMAEPQFVIRFCGDWIDSRRSYPAAVLRATGHRNVRQGALVFVEQTSAA